MIRRTFPFVVALTVSLAVMVTLSSPAQSAEPPTATPYTPSPENLAARRWFEEARFGLFIHWGVYAVPGGEYKGKQVKGGAEWIMEKLAIPVTEYEQFAPQFNPTKFDPAQWVRLAKQAGMKYITVTS